MMSLPRPALLGLALGLLAACGLARAESDDEVSFEAEIRPILELRCYECHGPITQENGLRVDSVKNILAGGEGGPAVEPGKSGESLLIEAITGAGGSRMPPEGDPLPADEIDLIKKWIDQGAKPPANDQAIDPKAHWSFLQPRRPALPAVSDPAWAAHPIDAFLAATYQAKGLTPRPEADRATLLRRILLDLTGLAPTRAELHAFLKDESPDAYAKAVDRLLASPAFGERWGRHWMDVWRYSDWYGYGAEVRNSQPHIWRWRDWIVESLNQAKPYDQMIVEMLAADEASPSDPEALRATGFLARSWYKFNRNVWLENTVEHTSKAFLGLTVNCAKCHDHKYDPIPQEDFYRMRAVFETEEVRADPDPSNPGEMGLVRAYDGKPDEPTYLFVKGDEKQPVKDKPLTPGAPSVLSASLPVSPVELPPSAYYPGLRSEVAAAHLAQAESKVAEAEKAVSSATEAGAKSRAELSLIAVRAARESLKARIAADRAKYLEKPDQATLDGLARAAGIAERQAEALKAEAALVNAEAALAKAKADSAAKPDDAKLKQAIDPAEKALTAAQEAAKKAREVLAKAPEPSYSPLTPVYPAKSTGRRLALARWIASKDNPLTARVAVNHIWMRHFGAPLVPTVFDFGRNGKAPTHPELLDWLAVELVDSGWDLKHLHRLILTSRAYRMKSAAAGPNDSNLAIDPTNTYLWRMNPRRMEAELVRDNLLWTAGTLDPTRGGPELDHASALTTSRRSLYYRHASEKQALFLKVFDAANVNACYQRDESVVPQQALALANSPLALAQSRRLAGTLSTEVGASPGSDEAFVLAAFEQILTRTPTEDERRLCLEYLAALSARLAKPEGLAAFTEGTPCPVPPSTDPHQRAREGLVHVLFNHNDYVTIR